MSGGLAGWRVALRLARRDTLRAKGRSALVLVMIALPVLGVTTAVVASSTSNVSTVEGLDRTLGSAQALVTVDASSGLAIEQDAEGGNSSPVGEKPVADRVTAANLSEALGGAPITPITTTDLDIRTKDGATNAEQIGVDLTDSLAAGTFRLVSGEVPTRAGEVAVNRALLDEGYVIGDPIRFRDGSTGPLIVGTVESTTSRTFPLLFATSDESSEADGVARDFLVGGSAVSWDTVQQLNARGALVVSRAVVLDPPPASEIPASVRSAGGDGQTTTVLALVVTMTLTEVVLLAGPAFAVGARRLQRSLALMAAAGGTPSQARRVVLASAVVLGLVAAVLGAVAGVALAAGLVPILQGRSDTYFGPFEIPWTIVLGIAGLGLLSALLAAAVPAWIASRQDVVAVLAGRRGDAAASARSPILGVIVLGAGVAVSIVGARSTGTELLIAAGALVSVLGMIFLVPLVVSRVAALASRLPLSLRYAARDAARHRTRTVPAVAAVAATVAGVVALLIATASDAAENRDTYRASYTPGTGVVYAYDGLDADRLAAAKALLGDALPQATLTPVAGVTSPRSDADAYSFTELVGPPDEPQLQASFGSGFGSSILVSDGDLPPGIPGLTDAGRDAARSALAAGRVVAFADQASPPSTAELEIRTQISSGSGVATAADSDTRTPVTATVVSAADSGAAPQGVIPVALAQKLDLDVGDTAVVVTGTTISPDREKQVSDSLLATDDQAGFMVERGYQSDDETAVLQLILIGLGSVLMLGGTLTATFLALSDARPDLATLAAVGASPRRRRGVAAGYALVVGLVGALLGALVGFVPGIAITYPLTSAGSADTGPYLDVPWLMVLGLVIGLPLVTAAIVAATTRSRLTLVARMD